MAFQTAIYTDVSRDEAVDGEDGFNFQSISEGVQGKQRQAIREVMLHKISGQWPLDKDERDHPPSFGFAFIEGSWYLSRGLSTGPTNNGRRGNQLTQAIVTDSAEDLEPYRPAQLYAAKNWSLRKAEGKDCPPWFAPLEIDPLFEAEALIEALRSDSWMRDTLPVFLTMIAHATSENSKKVVLVHDDLDTVMRWIATGTLLVSDEVAGKLELRAFVADPFRSRGQLIGTHPDILQGSLEGAHVINILERTVTPIEPSKGSLKIAEWAENLDTFDTLEAVEIAQRWLPAIGEELAFAGAEMVTGIRAELSNRESWMRGVQVMEALASAGLVDDLEMYMDELADSVSTYQLKGEADFLQAARSARFTMSERLEPLTEAILLPTLSSLAEDSELQWVKVWAEELSGGDDWRWPPTHEPEQFTLPLTELMNRSQDDALPALLRLARPLAPHVSERDVRPALERGVEYAFKHPEIASRDLQHWYGAERIESGLLRSIVAGASHRDQRICDRVHRQLLQGTWDFLDQSRKVEIGNAALAFSRWLHAAQVARVPIEQRGAVISSTTRILGPDTWTLALQSMVLPTHCEALVEWVKKVGLSAPLEAHIAANLDPLRRQEPGSVRRRDAQPWEPLISALVVADPENGVWLEAQADLSKLIESAPPRFKSPFTKFGSSGDRAKRGEKE